MTSEDKAPTLEFGRNEKPTADADPQTPCGGDLGDEPFGGEIRAALALRLSDAPRGRLERALASIAAAD